MFKLYLFTFKFGLQLFHVTPANGRPDDFDVTEASFLVFKIVWIFIQQHQVSEIPLF